MGGGSSILLDCANRGRAILGMALSRTAKLARSYRVAGERLRDVGFLSHKMARNRSFVVLALSVAKMDGKVVPLISRYHLILPQYSPRSYSSATRYNVAWYAI
jgi:hypothetical protein